MAGLAGGRADGTVNIMLRAVYSLLMVALQPLLLLRLLWRARREPAYGQALGQRFGHYRMAPLPDDGCTLWLHAVSLGEVRAAAVLLAALRPSLPSMRLLLTHGTATGWEEGARLLQPGDQQRWLPWDTPGAVRRFLRHAQPRVGVLMETETWPNLVAACADAGVPLLLVNARLSERSLARGLRFAPLMRATAQRLHAVVAQTDADAQRLRQLGSPVQALAGNLKYDAHPDAVALARARAWRQRHPGVRVVMLASSRAGEEQALLDALQAHRAPGQTQPADGAMHSVASTAIRWLVVPRHPQRFDAVAELLHASGLPVLRRSRWGDDGPDAQQPGIWLGDSLGEMAYYYGLADVVLLGGSFAPLGGQNLIEAAACGCALVLGPHTYNFAQAAELALEQGAAQRCADMAQAVQTAQGLLQSSRLAEMRHNATQLAQGQQGAAARYAAAVQQVWEIRVRAAR